jgi:hypothetical protein
MSIEWVITKGAGTLNGGIGGHHGGSATFLVMGVILPGKHAC